MDDRLVKPFLLSLDEVFTATMGVQPRPSGRDYLGDRRACLADVSSTVMFTGDLEGGITVGFPYASARSLAVAFLGMEVDTDDPAFVSAIGEIANMVAGVGKGRVDGLSLHISLPSVCVGRQHAVMPPTRVSRVHIPCTSSLGDLFLEISWVLGPENSVAANQDLAVAAAYGDKPK